MLIDTGTETKFDIWLHIGTCFVIHSCIWLYNNIILFVCLFVV